MKYKVGDKTLLGEITKVNDGISIPYRVERYWFTESEIDAIIIKPKRNIDHLVELIANGERANAVAFIDDCLQATSWLFWLHMLDEYTEPSKYPKLTPEELKAVKWLADGGFTRIKRLDDTWEIAESEENYLYLTSFMPTAKCLRDAKWITSEPINLAKLLAAQEGL